MSSNSPGSPSAYLLLFRNGGPEAHAHLSPEEQGALALRWNTWINQLVKQDVLEHGRPLGLGGRVVTGPRGERITDGPYAEAKEVVAGYVVVRADSLDAAAAIAQGCPGLAVGLVVEVRQLLDVSPVLAQVHARPPGNPSGA